MAPFTDFSLPALHRALDARREALGLSWTQAVGQINRTLEGTPVRPVSASTVKGLGTRAVAEADGVLQMLLWLERAPENFLMDGDAAPPAPALPAVPPGRILRFDTRKLYDALDAQRLKRKLTWAAVASEIGGPVSAASLTRLKKGGRTAFPAVMRITRWLGEPAARFTRPSER